MLALSRKKVSGKTVWSKT